MKNIISIKNKFGFTIIELLTSTSILGIIALIAVPNLSNQITVTRLKNQAENFASLARYAHMLAAKNGRNLYLHIKEADGGSAWCYGLSENKSCDCNTSSSCLVDGIEQSYRSSTNKIHIQANVAQNTFSFQHKRNTVTAGNVLFSSSTDLKLFVKISDQGRIRACTPDGNGNIAGLRIC